MGNYGFVRSLAHVGAYGGAGEMEEFHSEKLKDDLPDEEQETAEVELPCGDDY